MKEHYLHIIDRYSNWFKADNWRENEILNDKKFYYAIIHSEKQGDFVYHSIAEKGKNQWLFDTPAKLKVSLTNGVTGSGDITRELIECGIIEIKQVKYNIENGQ